MKEQLIELLKQSESAYSKFVNETSFMPDKAKFTADFLIAKGVCLEEKRCSRNEPTNCAEDLLIEIGIPPALLGFQYLVEAISMCYEDASYINGVTSRLYPDVAKALQAPNARSVERAIRHAIEVAWDRGDLDALHRLFGYNINSANGRPTNSEFIARMRIEVVRRMQ